MLIKIIKIPKKLFIHWSVYLFYFTKRHGSCAWHPIFWTQFYLSRLVPVKKNVLSWSHHLITWRSPLNIRPYFLFLHALDVGHTLSDHVTASIRTQLYRWFSLLIISALFIFLLLVIVLFRLHCPVICRTSNTLNSLWWILRRNCNSDPERYIKTILLKLQCTPSHFLKKLLAVVCITRCIINQQWPK